MDMNFALIYYQPDIDLIKDYFNNGDIKSMKVIMRKYGVISCSTCGYTAGEILSEFKRQMDEGII